MVSCPPLGRPTTAYIGVLHLGSEPWVKLSEAFPTGNAGKGVRSARNHAIKAGLTSEEWSFEKVLSAQVTDDLAKAAVLPLDFSLDLDQWVHLVWVVTPQVSGGGATDSQAYFSVSELALFSGANVPAVDAWLSR